MSGWPSGLRRQTQEYSLFLWRQRSILVHECGRGFESHFWQAFSVPASYFTPLLILHEILKISPPSRIWTSDLRMPVTLTYHLQSSALPTELSVVLSIGVCECTNRENLESTVSKNVGRSRGWFRSTDLWVMGPARFLCATLLIQKWRIFECCLNKLADAIFLRFLFTRYVTMRRHEWH